MAVELDGIRYLSNDEVARKLRISRQTLWRWRAAAKIPLGRQYRGRVVLFTQDEVTEIRRYAHRVEPAIPLAGSQLPLLTDRGE
jgi:predicted DNA-binding transcriptional regulator AlpA